MPPTPALTRAGRARCVALPAAAAARPLGRRARYRATAVAGGLAVLLAGSVTGHLPSTTGSGTGSAAAVHAATGGLSAVAGTLGAVARTGGQR